MPRNSYTRIKKKSKLVNFWEFLKKLKQFLKLIGSILLKKKSEADLLLKVSGAKAFIDLSNRGNQIKNWHDQILYDYAMSMVGKPYIYGGDDPMKGFDCSGGVIELMKSCGLVPNSYDATAQGLFDYFEKNRSEYHGVPSFGCLLYFGKSIKKITHIAFALDRFRMWEAGGGGSKILTVADAIKYNAYIRIRAIFIRKDLVRILKPHYSQIGAL